MKEAALKWRFPVITYLLILTTFGNGLTVNVKAPSAFPLTPLSTPGLVEARLQGGASTARNFMGREAASEEEAIVKRSIKTQEAMKASQDEAIKAFAEATESSKMPEDFKDKTAKANKKCKFMKSKSDKAADILSKIGPQGLGARGDPAVREHTKQMLKALTKIADHPEETNRISTEQAHADFTNSVMTPISDVEPSCPRDYTAQCPKDFVAVGTECWALKEYTGKCEKRQRHLYDMDERDREAWANACDTDWPCLPPTCPAGTNWNAPCPTNWSQNFSGDCEAPSDYNTGRCGSTANFIGQSMEERARFASKCGVRWPCKATRCKRDFNVLCPNGWTVEKNSICIAGDTYKGPCPRSANVTNFNEALKRNFEVLCFVEWPCGAACTRDYDTTACPLAWHQLSPGKCLAPAEYSGPCESVTDFGTLVEVSANTRKMHAMRCKVDFPCLDRSNCAKDFSSRCPVGWLADDDGQTCHPAAAYAGTCTTIVIMESFGELDKRKLEDKCNVEWPCKGEYSTSTAMTASLKPYAQAASTKGLSNKNVISDVFHLNLVDGPITS